MQNPLGRAWLQANDLLWRVLARRAAAELRPPRKVLIAIGGHLGDAVLATTVLIPLRSQWPDVEIGVLTGSWNRRVLDGHPEIARVHVHDHWKLDRSGRPWGYRMLATIRSARSAVAELRAHRYELAIDLYPYFPNAAALLSKAGIPVRIGYESGGGGPRYTHAVRWIPGGHVSEDHSRLLQEAGVAAPCDRYDLPPVDAADRKDGTRFLTTRTGGRDHVVIHSGAGRPEKRWPSERWVAVAGSLESTGLAVVATGAGTPDAEQIAAIRSGCPSVIDACDALSWGAFRHVIGTSRLTISVDSAAAHVAAAAGTPTIVIATGRDDRRRWKPLGRNVLQVAGSVGAGELARLATGLLRTREGVP